MGTLLGFVAAAVIVILVTFLSERHEFLYQMERPWFRKWFAEWARSVDLDPAWIPEQDFWASSLLPFVVFREWVEGEMRHGVVLPERSRKGPWRVRWVGFRAVWRRP